MLKIQITFGLDIKEGESLVKFHWILRGQQTKSSLLHLYLQQLENEVQYTIKGRKMVILIFLKIYYLYLFYLR